MKEDKKINQDHQSKNVQNKIKVGITLPEILKMRSRQGGYVAWPENTLPNGEQFSKNTALIFLDQQSSIG